MCLVSSNIEGGRRGEERIEGEGKERRKEGKIEGERKGKWREESRRGHKNGGGRNDGKGRRREGIRRMGREEGMRKERRDIDLTCWVWREDVLFTEE